MLSMKVQESSSRAETATATALGSKERRGERKGMGEKTKQA